MAEVDHVNRAYDETAKMRYFLQGVSASAIAFVFHETSDWALSPALYLAAAAAVFWAGSFAAGVRGSMHRQMTHMKAFGLEIFRGPNVDKAKLETLRQQFDTHNKATVRHYLLQEWLILVGSLVYAVAHGVHISEAQMKSQAGHHVLAGAIRTATLLQALA